MPISTYLSPYRLAGLLWPQNKTAKTQTSRQKELEATVRQRYLSYENKLQILEVMSSVAIVAGSLLQLMYYNDKNTCSDDFLSGLLIINSLTDLGKKLALWTNNQTLFKTTQGVQQVMTHPIPTMVVAAQTVLNHSWASGLLLSLPYLSGQVAKRAYMFLSEQAPEEKQIEAEILEELASRTARAASNTLVTGLRLLQQNPNTPPPRIEQTDPDIQKYIAGGIVLGACGTIFVLSKDPEKKQIAMNLYGIGMPMTAATLAFLVNGASGETVRTGSIPDQHGRVGVPFDQTIKPFDIAAGNDIIRIDVASAGSGSLPPFLTANIRTNDSVECAVSVGSINGLCVQGWLLGVASSNNEILQYNLSDPRICQLVSQTPVSASGWSCLHSGSTLLAGLANKVTFFDNSNPATPNPIRNLTMDRVYAMTEVAPGKFGAATDGGVRHFDVNGLLPGIYADNTPCVGIASKGDNQTVATCGPELVKLDPDLNKIANASLGELGMGVQIREDGIAEVVTQSGLLLEFNLTTLNLVKTTALSGARSIAHDQGETVIANPNGGGHITRPGYPMANFSTIGLGRSAAVGPFCYVQGAADGTLTFIQKAIGLMGTQSSPDHYAMEGQLKTPTAILSYLYNISIEGPTTSSPPTHTDSKAFTEPTPTDSATAQTAIQGSSSQAGGTTSHFNPGPSSSPNPASSAGTTTAVSTIDASKPATVTNPHR